MMLSEPFIDEPLTTYPSIELGGRDAYENNPLNLHVQTYEKYR